MMMEAIKHSQKLVLDNSWNGDSERKNGIYIKNLTMPIIASSVLCIIIGVDDRRRCVCRHDSSPTMRRLSRWRRRASVAALVLVVCLFLDLVEIISYRAPPPPPPPPDEAKPRIFIASIHRNDAKVLAGSWIAGVLSLVDGYGAERVYVSALESGSLDGSKEQLRRLDGLLAERGVRRSILLDPADQLAQISRSVTRAEPGWILTPRARFEARRIPHLAALRNRVMARLDEEQAAGRHYDVVLWLNDVVFQVRRLLD
jgi:hypothetical protein